jgi:hypothetical protein
VVASSTVPTYFPVFKGATSMEASAPTNPCYVAAYEGPFVLKDSLPQDIPNQHRHRYDQDRTERR